MFHVEHRRGGSSFEEHQHLSRTGCRTRCGCGVFHVEHAQRTAQRSVYQPAERDPTVNQEDCLTLSVASSYSGAPSGTTKTCL